MAVYKVPQDVEADDKLLGPFSFRQFIYLVIVAISIALAYFLSRIFIGLVIIPLPFVLFFGALAWPLRKDQPMEIYLAAMIKFFFKPRMRPWKPEGQVNLVTIVAPRTEEIAAASHLTQNEARERLEYLANVIDTQGWAARGVTNTAMMSLDDTVTAEASTINDVLDQSVGIGQQIDSLIEQQDEIRHQQAQRQFQQAIRQKHAAQSASPEPAMSQAPDAIQVYALPPEPAPPQSQAPIAHAYTQPVITQQSQSQQPVQHQTSRPTIQPPTSDFQPSPDIMRLANNNDLSISAIAREAHRLSEDSDEVVVSLR